MPKVEQAKLKRDLSSLDSDEEGMASNQSILDKIMQNPAFVVEVGSSHFSKLPAADQARILLLQGVKPTESENEQMIGAMSSSTMTSKLKKTLIECYHTQIKFERHLKRSGQMGGKK